MRLGLGLPWAARRAGATGGGPVYDPLAVVLFAQYLADTGTPLPDAQKTIYNQLYKDLRGTGNTGSDNCLTGYLVAMASVGYYDGVNKQLMLYDLLNPTAAKATEFSGGGNYIQNGTTPTTYNRQSVNSKAWNSQKIPSAFAGLTQDNLGFGAWSFRDFPANNNLYLVGGGNGVGQAEVSLAPKLASNNTFVAINSPSYFQVTTGSPKGYYEAERVSSTTCRLFIDGVQIGSDDTSTTSTAIVTRKLMMFGYSNNNGVTVIQTDASSLGVQAGVGLTLYNPSIVTPTMRTQFYNSFAAFFVSMGITL